MLFLILITPWERPQGLDKEPVSGSVIKCPMMSSNDFRVKKIYGWLLNTCTRTLTLAQITDHIYLWMASLTV